MDNQMLENSAVKIIKTKKVIKIAILMGIISLIIGIVWGYGYFRYDTELLTVTKVAIERDNPFISEGNRKVARKAIESMVSLNLEENGYHRKFSKLLRGDKEFFILSDLEIVELSLSCGEEDDTLEVWSGMKNSAIQVWVDRKGQFSLETGKAYYELTKLK